MQRFTKIELSTRRRVVFLVVLCFSSGNARGICYEYAFALRSCKKKTVAIENFFLKSRLLRISVLFGCLYMDFTTPYALPVSREVYCFYIKSTPIFVDVNTSATGQRFGSLEVIEAVVKTNSHQAAINLTKYAFPHALVHT